jgi:hypothetical protein
LPSARTRGNTREQWRHRCRRGPLLFVRLDTEVEPDSGSCYPWARSTLGDAADALSRLLRSLATRCALRGLARSSFRIVDVAVEIVSHFVEISSGIRSGQLGVHLIAHSMWRTRSALRPRVYPLSHVDTLQGACDPKRVITIEEYLAIDGRIVIGIRRRHFGDDHWIHITTLGGVTGMHYRPRVLVNDTRLVSMPTTSVDCPCILGS